MTTLNRDKTYARWIVTKSAKVRSELGDEIIDNLPFRKQCWELFNNGGKRSLVEYVGDDNRKHTGWVLNIAMTDKQINDYAHLLYENKNGKRVPVSNRYRGDVNGYINSGETVEVYFETDGWCLTNKGWTLLKFLKKRPGEFFDDYAKNLCTAIMLQAVKDYQIAIDRLKKGKCKDKDEYEKTFGMIEEITVFFNESEIRRGKFEKLNENLGVTKKWLKEKRRIYETLKAEKKEARFYKNRAKRKR